jgi:hypothetical protein
VSLGSIPAVRARSLTVYEQVPGAIYAVPGRERVYQVIVIPGGAGVACECPAGSSGARCAHRIAVEWFLKKQRETERGEMSKITMARGGASRKSIIVPKGIYGGMLSAYDFFEGEKYKSEEKEQKVALRFLLVTDMGAKLLPQFAEASLIGPARLTFDPSGRYKPSKLFEFWAAFLIPSWAGKPVAREDLLKWNDEDFPDLDDLLARPAVLSIEPATKAQGGEAWNKISGIMPATEDVKAAVRPLYAERDIQYNKNGLGYLAKPAPAEADDAPEAHEEDKDEEIPF